MQLLKTVFADIINLIKPIFIGGGSIAAITIIDVEYWIFTVLKLAIAVFTILWTYEKWIELRIKRKSKKMRTE